MFSGTAPVLRMFPLLALGLMLACGAAAAPVSTDPTPDPITVDAATSTATSVPESTSSDLTAPTGTAGEEPGTTTPEITATPRPTSTPAPTLTAEEKIVRDEVRRAGISSFGWKTDFSKHSVPFGEISSGGPPRDGIPPLDEPAFTTIGAADSWLEGKEPVIVLEINGDARAYPLQVLIWHEIVNDLVGEVPVSVTFCPLCNSAITFDRRLEGVVYDFGTSGNLRNSDLVMWDRQTESWWQQLTGEAIVGELTGKRLTFLPSPIISWNDFKAAHPQGQVLSKETGFPRPYGENPYVGYDRADQSPFLFRGDLDGRLLPKERIAAANIGDVDVAFPFSALEVERAVNYAVAGQDLVVFFKPGTRSALDGVLIGDSREIGATGMFDPQLDGRKLTFRADGDQFLDNETGSTWSILGEATAGPLVGKRLNPIVHANHFWFAWAAFRPDTLIYQGK